MGERSIADVLDAAADLIEPAGRWTQGAYARNIHGDDIVDDDDGSLVPREAVCFCVYGAVAFVEDQPIAESAAGAFLEMLGVQAVGWNDAPERTQAEVVAKLREAATLARTKEAEAHHG